MWITPGRDDARRLDVVSDSSRLSAVGGRPGGRARATEVLPSPNIWRWPEIYETENAAQDADGAIWAALDEHAPFAGATIADIGCGDGYHLPVFARSARTVIGVEPHEPLVERARLRVEDLDTVTVLHGPAQRLPLPEASVDVVHARTAYFFGPGCEPGLREAERVLRPGGVIAIVDLDATRHPYGEWMRADLPRYRSDEVERFFARHGFVSRPIDSVWRFADRSALEAVLRIEFTARTARRAIATTAGLSLPVGYRLRTRRKPTGLLS